MFPLGEMSKQQMGAECPKKNLSCLPVSTSRAIKVPPELNTHTFSLGKRDHLRLLQFSGEYPMMCLSSTTGSTFSLGDLLRPPSLYWPVAYYPRPREPVDSYAPAAYAPVAGNPLRFIPWPEFIIFLSVMLEA